ncbi:hypothetical protein D3C85_1380170 [compost metagenome]
MYLKEIPFTVVFVAVAILVSLKLAVKPFWVSCRVLRAELFMVAASHAVSTGRLKASYLVTIHPAEARSEKGELAGPVATGLSSLS